jgi:hypothetical protein
MSVVVTVEGKVIGQKNPIFSGWDVELPPSEHNRGGNLKLRDLISHVVTKEVEAFRERQQERRLASVMTRNDIKQGERKGKVDPGERDLNQIVNVEDAVATALQAFEDELYFVFIDEIQYTNLDAEIFPKTNSRVVFIRLTALTGG